MSHGLKLLLRVLRLLLLLGGLSCVLRLSYRLSCVLRLSHGLSHGLSYGLKLLLLLLKGGGRPALVVASVDGSCSSVCVARVCRPSLVLAVEVPLAFGAAVRVASSGS